MLVCPKWYFPPAVNKRCLIEVLKLIELRTNNESVQNRNVQLIYSTEAAHCDLFVEGKRTRKEDSSDIVRIQ